MNLFFLLLIFILNGCPVNTGSQNLRNLQVLEADYSMAISKRLVCTWFKIMLGHSFFSFLHFCLITLFCFIFLIEFLRRPPIDETSQLIKNIIKANETKRVKSYIEAGCINVHDSIQNTNKCKCKCNQYFTLPSLEFSILWLLVLFFCKTFWANCYALWHTEVHTCLLGLHNHLSKGNLFFSMLSNILTKESLSLEYV